MNEDKKTRGWGVVEESGAEIWDAEPLFRSSKISLKERFFLLLYPKKWFLYRFIAKDKKRKQTTERPYRVLDVGCGTGAAVIDLQKFLGDQVEVYGVDVVRLQIDLGKEKLRSYGVFSHIQWYDGKHLPFEDGFFDAIYSSDVLGHVEDVPFWLLEINRVLSGEGALALFSESKLGKHAFIRNFLAAKGVNTDPHAKYHISLYSKQELKNLFVSADFLIEQMYGSFWAKFFVHPDELFPALQNQNKFPILKKINAWLCFLKKKTHPFSTALAEFSGLIEMLCIGGMLETQGYVILGKKKSRS